MKEMLKKRITATSFINEISTVLGNWGGGEVGIGFISVVLVYL